jgi:hypothetical protein
MNRSATQQLADIVLDRPVEEYVAERREAGRSWRMVTRDLAEATGGRIDVTEVTLRSWMADLEPAEQVAS